jgi:hypothetical protein
MKNEKKSSTEEWLNDVKSTNDITKNYNKEYKEGLEHNTPSTGKDIYFNSTDAEYADLNVWSNEDLNKVAYNNQTTADKIEIILGQFSNNSTLQFGVLFLFALVIWKFFKRR